MPAHDSDTLRVPACIKPQRINFVTDDEIISHTSQNRQRGRKVPISSGKSTGNLVVKVDVRNVTNLR